MPARAMMLGVSYPPMVVTPSRTSVSGSRSSSPVESGSVTIQVTGGSGQFSFSWARTDGSSSVVATAPNSATTTFQAALSSGDSTSATYVGTATDLVTGETKTTGSISVNLTRNYPSLSASGYGNTNGSVNSYNTATANSGTFGVNVSGGVPPYSYNWQKTSFDPVSVNDSGSTASAQVSVGPGQGYYYSCRCIVSDQIGQQRTVEFSGLLQNTSSGAPPLSAGASPGSVYGIDTVPTVYTNSTTVTASGGVAPYSFGWIRTGGVGGASSHSASTNFYYTFSHYGDASGSFTCTVTDSIGQKAYAGVSAAWTYWGGGGGGGPIN